jgi:hypothetical protein
MQDHLRVRVIGSPAVSANLLELGTDRRVVVDLPVEDEPQRAVLIRHRLHRQRAEVDDRQPPEGEADPAIVTEP